MNNSASFSSLSIFDSVNCFKYYNNLLQILCMWLHCMYLKKNWWLAALQILINTEKVNPFIRNDVRFYIIM